MSKWGKLLKRICSLSKDFRLEELRMALESYGHVMNAPGGGSSHIHSRMMFVSEEHSSILMHKPHPHPLGAFFEEM